jgi:hypothetical protein
MMASPDHRNFLSRENDVIISDISIISSTGFTSSLLGVVTSLVLYEDISKNFMTGKIMIADANDFMRTVPVEGKEVIRIRYITPINDDVKEVKMRIHSQSERTPTQRSDVLIFRLISTSAYKDLTTVLSRSYKGTHADIVESLVNDYYGKPLAYNLTQGEFTKAFTYNRPSKIINRLCRSSIPSESEASQEASGFLFYETASGFHFKCLTEMYRKGAITHYVNSKVGRVSIEQDNLRTQFHNMRNVKFLEGFPRIKNVTEGAFNSLQFSFDPTTVSWGVDTFSYNDSFLNKMGDKFAFPILSPDDGDNFTPSRVFLTNRVRESVDGQYEDIDTKKLSRQFAASNYSTRNNTSVNFSIQGNSLLEAGDVLQLLFTRNVPDSSLTDGEYDPNLTGRYLINQINNQFIFNEDGSQTHTAHLNCIRNFKGEASVSSSRLAVEQ